MQRKGLIGAAAVAALACAGLVKADQVTPRDPRLTSADLALTPPLYLQESPAAAPTPPPDVTPLMGLLDKAGVGKSLREAGINVGGYVEGSYTYSASSPPGNQITGRVFDFEHEDPTLNQVMVFAEKTVDDAITKKQFDIGGRVEWRYGADSRGIHSLGLFDHYGYFNVPSADDANHPENQFDLTQAYADFAIPIGNGLKVRVGKFVTPIGNETIDPTTNYFYSHSYLFGYAIPFTHTGVTATYKVNDKFLVTAGVTRGWDTSLEDDNDTVDFLGTLTYTVSDSTTLVVNVISGPDQPGNNSDYRSLVDVILTQNVGDNLQLAFNGDYAYERNSVATGTDAQWWGVAAYFKTGLGTTLKNNPVVALVGRAEYFNDDDGARLTGAVGGAGVFEATLGLNITPFPSDTYGKYFSIRPEVRYDYASKNFFDGGTDRYQLTAAIDAFYKF